MTSLNIIGYILLVILITLCFMAALGIYRYLSIFYHHSCKHCGKYMEYKGLKEDNDNGHFLFHCPNCGAWEQIPKENLLRNNKDEGTTVA